MRKIYSQLNIFIPSIKYKYPLTLIVLLLIQVNVFAGRDEFKKTNRRSQNRGRCRKGI